MPNAKTKKLLTPQRRVCVCAWGEYLWVACANGATTKTMSGSSPDDNTLSDRAINELDVLLCVCVCVCVPKGLMCVLLGLGVQGVGYV